MLVITAQIKSRFIVEDDLVPFRCSPIQSYVTTLEWMCRWVDVIGSTRNGHRNARCSSARRLVMVWKTKGPLGRCCLCPDSGQRGSWLFACGSYDVTVFSTTGLPWRSKRPPCKRRLLSPLISTPPHSQIRAAYLTS
ncbi:hypothetical protein TNCV_2462931 [Trichonephila clavipes]|nr:hypothetical protein TNCV_2462931 [Trichonephila clavipes]